MTISRRVARPDGLPGAGVGGFTLVEMMVTLAIMAVLMVLALPSFRDLMLSSKLSSYSTDLVVSMQLARSEAIKRNAAVTLCASTDGAACAANWGDGWIVLSGGDVLQRQQALPSGWNAIETSGTSSLTFQPTGVGVTQAEFTFCRSSPLGNKERVVTVSATGSASVKTTETGTCS